MKKWLLVLLSIFLFICLVGPFVIPLPQQPDMSPDAVAPGTGHFLTVDGLRTYVQDLGPREGPAVVFIHGFGGSTFSWRETLPVLASAGFRSIALDLKGFGLSDKRFEEDYTHRSQADYVARVMEELGVDKAVVVGHSMGASVAAHLAVRYPDKVEKILFVDGAVDVEDEESSLDPIGWLVRIPPLRQWARFVMRWQLDEETIAERLSTAYFDPDFVTPEVEDGYLTPQRIKDWELALLGIMRDSSKNSLTSSELEGIDTPVLIIWGEEDTWVPLSRGRTLASSLEGSELSVIPLSGHLPMEEQAEQFNERLLEFLQEE